MFLKCVRCKYFVCLLVYSYHTASIYIVQLAHNTVKAIFCLSYVFLITIQYNTIQCDTIIKIEAIAGVMQLLGELNYQSCSAGFGFLDKPDQETEKPFNSGEKRNSSNLLLILYNRSLVSFVWGLTNTSLCTCSDNDRTNRPLRNSRKVRL